MSCIANLSPKFRPPKPSLDRAPVATPRGGMIGTHAQFEDKSISVEAGIADMLIRMETGRFKVFKHLTDWFDEFRLYHRKDGRVHKEGDDLMSATRYGVMMLRYATTSLPPKPRRRIRSWGGWQAA